MTVTSKVIGAAEIEALLKQLPDKVARKVVGQSLRRGGTSLVKRAKANLESNQSVDSGLLKSKIGVRQSKGKAAVGILKGSQTVTRKGRKPERATPTRYAHLIEFGTKNIPAKPFLRPALDEGGSEAIKIIGEAMGKGVMKEATIMAAKNKR